MKNNFTYKATLITILLLSNKKLVVKQGSNNELITLGKVML